MPCGLCLWLRLWLADGGIGVERQGLFVAVVEKRLMDVKLGELGSWFGGRDFTPNGLLASLRNGRSRYFNKYINVKKGGIGGLAMLIGGYVVISYMWEYDHLKHDRWRKYH
ncbi:hypothetical protein CRUP_032879 [Coryphaenoides rupestris]|nr:hypothetical protein CRUP_032879 [Coryphaenoides rupestris]